MKNLLTYTAHDLAGESDKKYCMRGTKAREIQQKMIDCCGGREPEVGKKINHLGVTIHEWRD